LELKDIKIIIDLMKKNDLSVFLLEREGFKLKISRGGDAAAPGNYVIAAPAPGIALPAAAAAPAVSAAPAAAPAAPEKEKSNLRDIPSPMVGTYYQAMSPEAPAYVKVGQAVQEDTVVCIIEAMKVMNEIKAETSGIIAEILVENGKSVQFGQPLFRVRPA
jgi:acetyl-CoA carboxylase biotin carboxyl carrier protein